MSTGTTVVIVVIAIIVVGAVAAVAFSAARRRRLQQRFGPEYDRLVEERDSRLKAESELSRRERRVSKLDIKPLDPAARARYAQEWTTIQEQFVDAPQGAVAQAQSLVVAVMRERGYPTDDQDQLMADLSVEHASFLDHYRAASAISEQAAASSPSTEDLRQAMIHYRALFKDLLGEPADPAGRTATGTVAADAASPQDDAEGDAVLAESGPVTASPAIADPRPASTVPASPVAASPQPVPAEPGPDVAAERARTSVAGGAPAAPATDTEPAVAEPVMETDPVHDDLHVVTPDDGTAARAGRAPTDTIPDELPADEAPPADTRAATAEDSADDPADPEPERASLGDSIRRRIRR
jgi:hypothetical protein